MQNNRTSTLNNRRNMNRTRKSSGSSDEVVFRNLTSTATQAQKQAATYKQMNDERAKNLARLIDLEESSSFSFGGLCCKFFIFLILVLAVMMATMPIFNLTHPLKASYIKLPDLPELVGALKANDKLTKAVYLAYKKVVGPETIVFSSNGSMYTGLLNGNIVRIDSLGNTHKVVRFGDEKNETSCDELIANSKASCGRPLGMRIRPNTDFLYVADAYIGVFKVNLKTAQKTLLLSANNSAFGLQPMKMVNDIEFDDLDENVIYIIDSSNERNVHEAIEEHTEANARGRLFKYNEKSSQVEFLLENLYFPNGLAMMPSKDSLLINECSMSRIIRYYLKGAKQGTREVWAELPGFGDTIRFTEHNTLLVPIAASRYGKFPSVLDMLGEYPVIRTILGTIFNMRRIFLMLPKYGLLVEYDLNGKPLKSWHDSTGTKVQAISHATLHNKKLFLGSFYSEYIAVVDY